MVNNKIENPADVTFFMRNRRILYIAMGVVLLLMIPLIAMQFSDEVNWSPFDFVVMGTLLFGTGLTYELISRKAGNTAYKAAVGIAVFAGLILIWGNLAVGLIGSEDNPVNGLYFVLLFIGAISAAVVQLEPKKMARVMFMLAIGQALIPVIALVTPLSPNISGEDNFAPGVLQVFILNGVFVMMFIASGLLFQHATIKNPK